MHHLDSARLLAALDHIRASPRDGGELQLIARRPAPGERDLPRHATLDLVEGVVGDSWRTRGSRRGLDGAADPDAQVTVMNARVAELVAGGAARMALAGDQLYVDLDLSIDNLPAGSVLVLGNARLLVTATPHTGCRKFVERFGPDAMRFVNSALGRQLRLRGMNTRVLRAGTVRVGDVLRKATSREPAQDVAELVC